MIFVTPHTFIFFSVYMLFIYLLLCVDRFFVFWSFIEMRTLVFMGISYSLFKNNFSSLLLFFIIQTISAFSLLLFYCLISRFMFTFFILIKLSIFPFYFWYLGVVYRFPTFIFFFSSTFFKIPTFLLVFEFGFLLHALLVFLSIILTILAGAMVMIFSNEFRILLVASSIVNNSWFFLSSYVSVYLFFAYMFIYSIVLGVLLSSGSQLFSFSFLIYIPKYTYIFIISFLTLAGLPPFPLFYIKMVVVFSLVSFFSGLFYLFFIILFTVFSMLGYLKHVFMIIEFNRSNSFILSV